MDATVAEIEIPTQDFLAGEMFTTVDGLVIEAESVVAHADNQAIPLAWIGSSPVPREELERALERDATVDSFELLCDHERRGLYRVAWSDEHAAICDPLVDKGGTVLSAVGSDSTWNLRFLFARREALSTAFDHFDASGVGFDVRRIYTLQEGRDGRFGLSEAQRDLLVRAYESGYFEVPRESTGQDLAEKVGTNHQSVSEMFRRAHSNLVANTLVQIPLTESSVPGASRRDADGSVETSLWTR